MATTIDKPAALDVNGISNPANISQRRISANLDGDQISSTVENEGNKKIFDKASKTLGKQDFLNLLMTQMRFQDPLQPTENTEFVAQLAQFSSLEGTQNINDAIDDLSKKMETMVANQSASANTMSNASATSLIGKAVRVNAKDIVFDPSKKEPIEIDVHVETADSVLSIVDSEGTIVNAIPLDVAGERKINWSGLTMDGKMAPAGAYELKVTSRDGLKETGYTFIEDKVNGISFGKTGMRLDVRGQSIGMDQVVHVSEAAAAE